MFTQAHTISALRFRRWSRKSYAAFQSIGRHVTIGNLKNIVADTFLGKQKNTSATIVVDIAQKEIEEEMSDPPDDIINLFPENLPLIPKSICVKTAHFNFYIHIYSWLIALLLSAIFILNLKN
ncbi:hypothetical protein [Niabella ginsengisoli]|uniref:Uncharacterized protein n=1 Tax=Niabella ginsengisoli TaxID=522298 RepID=A0ABS9SMZ0_9BACT|nr:hypothetical protein [Niabella ginsengisoli]MCH5599718.1 hypothetical protein [Niabella ginsengisoli]